MVKPTYEELEKKIQELEQVESEHLQTEKALKKQIMELNQPIKEDENIVTFEDLFKIEDIQRLQDEFAKATNVASIITRADGTPITAPSNFCRLCEDIIRKTEKGLTNCFKSDAVIGRFHPDGPIVQPCMSGGLWDAGAGITVGGKHIANWLIGQVRDETQTEEKMLEYAREIGASEKDVVEAFREVSAMSHEQFERIAKMLYTLANQLSTFAYQNVQRTRFIKEQEYAEKKLQRSEEKYRLLADNITDNIWVLDLTTLKFSYLSPSIIGITGYSADELMGHHLQDVLTPSSMDFATNMLSEELSTESQNKDPSRSRILELEQYHKDGTTVWTEVSVRFIYDNEGQPTSILGVTRDITERKQAEKALKRSEALQGKMVANIGDVIVIVDQDGVNQYKSPNIERLFGWKPEDVVGTSTWENVHPEDLESTQKFFKTIIHEPNAVGTTECQYKCKDGSYRWIEFTGSNLLHDPDILGILGNYHDITDRKQAEQSLRESEARFKSLHNASFGGIAIHDKGIILECNQGLSEITGYSVTELIGMDGLLLIAEKSRNAVMNKIVSGYEKPYEAIGLRKNGEAFPIRLEARNIPYKGKKVRTVEFRDITDKKRAEEDREKLQNQLIHAQKMEAIGTLAGGIAHDFNNILSPLLGYTEMLKGDLPADHPFQANADIMLNAALRARDLVKQILTFSRKSELEIKPIKLQAIVKEAVKLLNSSIPKTIDINENIDASCDAVNADPTKFHQIIMNLATNAYHSMDDTGGKLTISLNQVHIEQDSSEYTDLLPGTYARLTVTDTGIGIGKDVIGKVFDPYFTTKEPGKGTGLGLSVVHGIVKEFNGDIRILSEPGKGTEIHVYLPIIERMVEKRVETTGLVIGGTERILLVDDEEAVIRMEERMLEQLGYQVTTRTSSIEALEMFKANSEGFDLIVSDISMPNMTGTQLAQKIKNIKADIPIIICTGFSDQLTNEKIRALGIQGYILKPVIIRELAEIVRNVLDTSEEI